MPANVPNLAITLESTAKPWWRSKVIWFNAVGLALATFSVAQDHLQLLQAVLPHGLYAVLAFVLPIGNSALRFVTTSSLALRRAPELGLPPVPWADPPSEGAAPPAASPQGVTHS